MLSFTAASYGDLNTSAFPTLGAQKHAPLSCCAAHLPITVPVELPSSMELWKFPHKLLLIYPCRIGATAHSRGFLDSIATAAKTGILLLLLQSSCRSPCKAERRCSTGAGMPQNCHCCLGVALVSGASANGTFAKREKECSLVPQ